MQLEFDAARLAHEQDGPRRAWPLAALLYQFRKELLTPPWLCDQPERRLEALGDIAAVLTDRGLDVAAIVRWGLGDRLVRAVLAGLAARELVIVLFGHTADEAHDRWMKHVLPQMLERRPPPGHQESPATPDGRPTLPTLCFDHDHLERSALETQQAVAQVPARARTELVRVVGRGTAGVMRNADRVTSWVTSAALYDLFAYRPTDHSSRRPAPSTDVSDQYRWLVERLTITYIAQWSTSSLHLEARHQDGAAQAPCRHDDFDVRDISRPSLDAAIAQRAVSPATASRLTLDQANDQALRLLQDDKRPAATALLSSVLDDLPDSAEANNNYGFCLLPDRPDEAVLHLERARSLGYENPATNAVNLMQAHQLLGSHKSALDVAERLWRIRDAAVPKYPAQLWRFSGPRPELVIIDDPRPTVYVLAAASAETLGDPSLEEWLQRHDAADCDACSYLPGVCKDLVPSA